MAKAMDMLRKLRKMTSPRAEAPAVETVFERRLQKLGGVRPVSVARAVLFRTQPARQEA